MRRVRTVFAAALAVAAFGLVPSAAMAAFLPPVVLSATADAQADGPVQTEKSVVSADGRYVVFYSVATNLYPANAFPGAVISGGGLFRRDLASGTLELVIPVNMAPSGTPTTTALASPDSSISGDGRFVVFSAAGSARLSPGDTNAAIDVYRRDMTVPLGAPGAFALVSAVDGGDGALSYAPLSSGNRLLSTHAISEDGNRVAFAITGSSNIGDMTSTATTSPSNQVVVRDIAAKRTILLSTSRVAPYGPAPTFGSFVAPMISGDGSAVAWETPDPGLHVAIDDTVSGKFVRAVVWKRVADGAAPTARYAAGPYDPDDPACPDGGQPTRALEPGPCDGPFPIFGTRTISGDGRASSALLSGISADGNTLLVRANTLRDGALLQLDAELGGRDDLFLVDMTPGLTRKAAVTPVAVGADTRTAAAVKSADLSPDGQWIAFTAQTWSPRLTSPAPVGAFVLPLDPAYATLYVIDRAAGTIEQLSRAYDGSGLNGAVTGGSIARGGAAVAAEAAQGATTLFYGDANGQIDAVAYRRPALPAVPPPTAVEVPPATAQVPLAETRTLVASGRSLAGGTVRITIDAPASGSLAVVATDTPAVRRSGRKTPKAKRISRRITRTTPRGQTLTIDLKLLAKYAKYARRRGGLAGTATVTFKPAGGSAQTRTLAVRFARKPLKTVTTAAVPKAGS